MTTTIENQDIKIHSDLSAVEFDDLLGNIVKNNSENRYILEKIIETDEPALSEGTYSELYNEIEKYINIPIYTKDFNEVSATFQVIQEWEGYVQEINNDTFTASLLDITANQNYPTEEADFNIEDVNKFDRHFLRNGAIFRWVIGYYQSPAGSKRRSSELVFRRMSRFSSSSIKKADKKAKEFKDEIIWE
jgi:hypothetical protein